MQSTAAALAIVASFQAAPRSVYARAGEALEFVTEITEYGIKAQFLQRLSTPYVKWPASSFESDNAPFIVAVIGKDPFGKKLEEAFKDRKVESRTVKIVRFESIDKLEACQILFVPEALERQLEKIQLFYANKPVLFVGESLEAAQTGAHIGCYMEKSKLRFAINPTQAKKSKLEISSELLKLAKIVETKAEDSQ